MCATTIFAPLSELRRTPRRETELRSQIDVALRLQFSDAYDAALFSGDKARKQIRQRQVLRLHRIAAGREREPSFSKTGDPRGDVRTGRVPLERLERRAVHDQRDRHLVRTTHALEMVLNIAKYEIDLVAVAEVIDDLGAIRRRRGRCRDAPGREPCPEARQRGHKQIAPMHAWDRFHLFPVFPASYFRRIAASSLRSVTSERHS